MWDRFPARFPGPYDSHSSRRSTCAPCAHAVAVAAQQLPPLLGACAVLGEGIWVDHGAGNTKVGDSVPLLAI